ncbi:hypothetical protein H6G65_12335 [Microcystis elabens FACHB-917]|nr:hypothetical protein [Microcystis elabens FACHB-917]
MAGSLVLVAWVDRRLLGRGVPSLGPLVVSLYGLTYGLGWLLWRLDPSSLFGYGSRSTLGALDGLGLLFAFGLPGLALGYGTVRLAWPLRSAASPIPDRQTLLARQGPVLQCLCEILLVLALVGLVGMASQGVFLRDPEAQRQALQSSPLAKLLVGSGLLSRLAPVGLVLVPLVWTRWRHWQRLAVVVLLLAWLVLGLASGSRGQLFTVPVYLFVGALLWRRLSWRRAVLFALAGLVAGVVVAEGVRVRREGNPADPSLRRQFETFQIGRQLLGTSHEFYALLRPADCAADLTDALRRDPSLVQLLQRPTPALSVAERYHGVRLYDACRRRRLVPIGWQGFERLPAGLLPSTLVPGAPSLFDGQARVEALSTSLRLRPGEISYGTLSLFADGWLRFRWPGVVLLPAAIGALLALAQNMLLLLAGRRPLLALLWQLLALSLIGSWINNTVLTMLWSLGWDLPKTAFALAFLAILARRWSGGLQPAAAGRIPAESGPQGPRPPG